MIKTLEKRHKLNMMAPNKANQLIFFIFLNSSFLFVCKERLSKDKP
ncbi:hypothetical protein OENI_270005 [Oenococcus oeni]|nr:hypothetical protein OENI_270005 [Oenococcus oeni]